MRLKQRELTEVKIAPRICEIGALGSVRERFSDESVSISARVLPCGEAFDRTDAGIRDNDAVRILMPIGAEVKSGDGVIVQDTMYVVRTIRKWRAHIDLICAKAK